MLKLTSVWESTRGTTAEQVRIMVSRKGRELENNRGFIDQPGERCFNSKSEAEPASKRKPKAASIPVGSSTWNAYQCINALITVFHAACFWPKRQAEAASARLSRRIEQIQADESTLDLGRPSPTDPNRALHR